jgi:hypothetical protein
MTATSSVFLHKLPFGEGRAFIPHPQTFMLTDSVLGVRGRGNHDHTPLSDGLTNSNGGGRVWAGGGGGASRPLSTWSWKGQTNFLGFDMEREKKHSHTL